VQAEKVLTRNRGVGIGSAYLIPFRIVKKLRKRPADFCAVEKGGPSEEEDRHCNFWGEKSWNRGKPCPNEEMGGNT